MNWCQLDLDPSGCLWLGTSQCNLSQVNPDGVHALAIKLLGIAFGEGRALV